MMGFRSPLFLLGLARAGGLGVVSSPSVAVVTPCRHARNMTPDRATEAVTPCRRVRQL
jgi:hypothetical protein